MTESGVDLQICCGSHQTKKPGFSLHLCCSSQTLPTLAPTLQSPAGSTPFSDYFSDFVGIIKVILFANRQPGTSHFLKERPSTSWGHPHVQLLPAAVNSVVSLCLTNENSPQQEWRGKV